MISNLKTESDPLEKQSMKKICMVCWVDDQMNFIMGGDG